jgi:hypothetical protein
LAVVDDYIRECLTLVADTSISGTRVACELDKMPAGRDLDAAWDKLGRSMVNT